LLPQPKQTARKPISTNNTILEITFFISPLLWLSVCFVFNVYIVCNVFYIPYHFFFRAVFGCMELTDRYFLFSHVAPHLVLMI
jgi:hypothetical protein